MKPNDVLAYERGMASYDLCMQRLTTSVVVHPTFSNRFDLSHALRLPSHWEHRVFCFPPGSDFEIVYVFGPPLVSMLSYRY